VAAAVPDLPYAAAAEKPRYESGSDRITVIMWRRRWLRRWVVVGGRPRSRRPRRFPLDSSPRPVSEEESTIIYIIYYIVVGIYYYNSAVVDENGTAATTLMGWPRRL